MGMGRTFCYTFVSLLIRTLIDCDLLCAGMEKMTAEASVSTP